VYFGAYDGKVYAVHADTGEIVWINCTADWVGSSPAIVPNKKMLVIGFEYSLPGSKGATVALSLETGDVLWEYKMQAFTHASPLYIEASDSIVIGGNEGKLYCLNAVDGTLRWSYETEGGQTYVGHSGFSRGDIKLSPSYDEQTDTIAFSSYDGHMYMVHAKDGKYIRRFQTERSDTSVPISIYGKPIFTNTAVIFAALDRHVYCYNKHSGELCWKFETEGRIFSSPVQYGESIFVGANDGALYELEVKTGRLLSKYFIPDRIVSPVVIEATDGRVRAFIITNSTHLYCLELDGVYNKFQHE
jgi:outer membrane protein assembly factor BamB